MRLSRVQYLAVGLLLLCFAAILPSHAHAVGLGDAHAPTAGTHDDADHLPSHAPNDCPACRLVGGLGWFAAGCLTLIDIETVHHVLPVDDERPAMVRITLPFHGRAPPIG